MQLPDLTLCFYNIFSIHKLHRLRGTLSIDLNTNTVKRNRTTRMDEGASEVCYTSEVRTRVHLLQKESLKVWSLIPPASSNA